MLDWPQNTAWEQDLIVQLLGGPTFDYGALLVIHVDVVPHVVGGGNRTDVVDLQPTTAETNQDIVSEKPSNKNIEGGKRNKESEQLTLTFWTRVITKQYMKGFVFSLFYLDEHRSIIWLLFGYSVHFMSQRFQSNYINLLAKHETCSEAWECQ